MAPVLSLPCSIVAPLGQRVGSGASGEIAADTEATLSTVKLVFEQVGGALTGLQRATAPSGRLTEYAVHDEGSDDG